jgi:hypothetical protein
MFEIECMEAEAREFREELWKVAEDETLDRRGFSKSSVLPRLRVATIAAALVLASGLPLSLDQDRPFHGFQSEVAVITSTESDILQALRESLSNHNTGRVVLSMELPNSDTARIGTAAASQLPVIQPTEAAKPVVFEKVAVLRAREDIVAEAMKETPTSEPAKTAAASEPSVEEVISLIQVGQRALRVSEPAVMVISIK